MLKRKLLQALTDWKERKTRKSLLIQGARQVGKTYIIREFGKTHYPEIVEINFKENADAASVFSGNLDTDTLIMALRFRFPEKKLEAGKTLIFLDEIQECAEAIMSLKFWTADGRFDVIASGSMLGIDFRRASSYPVGYVDYLQMYALDFEEYLWARNISDDMIRHVKEYFDKKTIVPTAIHDRLMQLFREYLAIGGMPEVVQTFVDTSDYREADRVQKALLQGYRYDIAHYATAEEKVKAERCYLSLSRQLLDKENHKFQYKEVEHGGRAQKYYSSMDWLLRADLIRMSRLVTDVKYDLEDYAREDFFRAYTTDLSLLIAMRDFSLKQHIVEDTLTGTTKGGLFECAVADILIKKGLNLYFYKHDTNQKELDFLIQTDGQVIPIEVKSGNTRATSLKWLKQRNPEISTMYKLISGNTSVSDEGIITLPVYMAMFL